MKLKPRAAWVLPILAMLTSSAIYVGVDMARGDETGAAKASASGVGGAATEGSLVDPLSMFSARSPGMRPDGAFLQTKRAYAAATDFVRPKETYGMPFDQSLAPQESPAKEEPVLGALQSPDGFPVDGTPSQDGGPSGGESGGQGGGQGSVFARSFSSGGLIAGFGGSGTGGGGGDVGGEGGEIVTDVPEPGTWFMMIVGFLAIGATARSRRREQSQGQALCGGG